MNINKILCQRFSFDKNIVTVGSILAFGACYTFWLCVVICTIACVLNGVYIWITDFSYVIGLCNIYPEKMSPNMVFDYISVLLVTGMVVGYTLWYGPNIVYYVFDIEIVKCKRKQP